MGGDDDDRSAQVTVRGAAHIRHFFVRNCSLGCGVDAAGNSYDRNNGQLRYSNVALNRFRAGPNMGMRLKRRSAH